MHLKEYLYLQRLTVREFAEILDYSRVHISALANGKSFASPKLVRRIERLTEGKVTKDDIPMKPEDIDSMK